MRMIGLIGGMSWESSAVYYRLLNEGVRTARGPSASAPCLLWSFDFAAIEALQHAGDWDALEALMTDAARRLAGAGAGTLVICTNTMHRFADAVEAAAGVPVLHIADPTGAAIGAAGLVRVGLIGTRFTMEQDFIRGRLARRHGLSVLIPGDTDRAIVHATIYDELIAGRVLDTSRAALHDVIARLIDAGAQGVILGCTELMLLVRPEACAVPVFDTTTLHARAAVAAALSGPAC
ncbi:aspartate/glutamate racemase family protein [Sphingomonas sp.]|uniref:aspartate/glutamate racemase family protein n=1 Tax=Sphingomonas sp. TaxID=28214 RepID=UPI001ECA22CB|nr:aspartate/glutamate racemase family protein [Sphingomonas sp.]MBX3595632.1 aspartate/glutamate racemase family protein [Sphingomonas sp.]